MQRLACVIAAGLLLVSPIGAATNLNSSKSDCCFMTYSKAIMTPAQAAAILAELDRTPRMEDEAIRRALPALLKKNGVDPAKVKKTIVKRDESRRKSMSIIVLDKPEDEAAALAVSDEGAQGSKPIKKGKN